MAQPTMDLSQASSRRDPRSPTGFVLTGVEKGLILCLLLGILYLRLYKRKRSRDKVCSHCGTRNPSHQTNCRQCSAPLFTK
jgi:ribosomal protein L40E